MIFKVKQGDFIYPINVDVQTNNGRIYIRSPYNPQLVEEMRAMQNSQWDRDNKYWHMPLTERNVYAIEFLSGHRPHYYNKLKLFPLQTEHPLYQHQETIVQFILNRKRVGIAGDMGVGKTLAALTVIEEAAALHNAYIWWVVAPKGALTEWKRQIIRWKPQIKPAVFTTYESLYKYMDAMPNPPHGVIFDESIKIKNPSAQRSQIANELAKLIRKNDGYIVCMSGRPAPKDPSEWWHQTEILCPGFIREGSIHKFRNRYAEIEYIDGEYGTYPELKCWKEDEVKKLGKRLAPIWLVISKEECFDFPQKIYDVITVDPSPSLLATAMILLDSSESALIGAERCRQLSDGFQYNHEISPTTGKPVITGYEWIGSPKIQVIKDLLDFYSFENGGPGRLVIYASYRAIVEKLAEVVREQGWAAAPILDDTFNKQKQLVGYDSETKKAIYTTDVIDDFQDKDESFGNMCIIGNPARFHGLTLTRTEALVYYNNAFDYDARPQSEDRRDRPGMDIKKGTRIVDIINLPTDIKVKTALETSDGLRKLTIEGLKECLSM